MLVPYILGPASYRGAMRKALWESILLVSVGAGAATGSFTGQVVNAPSLEGGKKWVFVQGKKGATRKVEISSAKVVLGKEVPKQARVGNPEDAVREGAQVRVTASQDESGEWKASEVEVLAPAE
jgi:hypothetical protein